MGDLQPGWTAGVGAKVNAGGASAGTSPVADGNGGYAWQTVSGGGGAPTGAAGGDLSGTYPNPTVAKVNGQTLGNAALAAIDTTATDIAMNGVQAAGSTGKVADAGHVHPTDTSRAPVANPTFTGTPAVPTAAVDTNTTQAASTAFVLAQAASATPLADGTAAVGTSTRYARADHVHPGSVVRTLHTFAVTGLVQVASGDTNYLPPFFVSLASDETATIVKVRAVIHGGTSATVKLQKNGVDITGFTGISVTQTAASTTPTAVAVAEDDLIALVVTAVSGSPVNMTVTVVIEHTI